MRYLRHLVLLSLLTLPVVSAHAGVTVGVAVAPGYVGPAPVCSYGYYGYYPYACAPYGYYGPSWFVGGVFIGAGPWYHGYYGPGFYRPNLYARGWYGPGPFAHPGYGYYNHGGYAYHGPVARGQVGGGFRGGAGGFHGGVHR
jgi:hypothetical protein